MQFDSNNELSEILSPSAPCEICGHRVCSHDPVKKIDPDELVYESRLKETKNLVSLMAEDALVYEEVRSFFDKRKRYLESEERLMKIIESMLILKGK